MAGIENVFKVLEFDKNNIQLYLNELTVWTMCAEVKRKKQGSLAWNSLPTVIKHFINDSIGMEDFNEDDGIDKFIVAIRKTFEQESKTKVSSKWKVFDETNRKQYEDEDDLESIEDGEKWFESNVQDSTQKLFSDDDVALCSKNGNRKMHKGGQCFKDDLESIKDDDSEDNDLDTGEWFDQYFDKLKAEEKNRRMIEEAQDLDDYQDSTQKLFSDEEVVQYFKNLKVEERNSRMQDFKNLGIKI